MSGPWIGVDFDGTLCEHDHGTNAWCGRPVQAMLDRVKGWLAEGKEVRIVTARVGPGMTQDERCENIEAIVAWCEHYIGQHLPIVCAKDYGMVELWDDRAVQVIRNTGIRADEAAADSVVGAIAAWVEQTYGNSDDLRDKLVGGILGGAWK